MAKKYCAGETFGYWWEEQEVKEFIKVWDKGVRCVVDLSDMFERRQCDVAILIMDLSERGFITPEGKTKRRNIFSEVD